MDPSQLPESEARRLPARSWLERQLARPARMRRRFGIRYLLAVTTASAVLFAALPGGLALFLFATTVLAGTAQLVWPKHPRWASILAGVLMMFGLLLTVFFRRGGIRDVYETWIGIVCGATILGIPLGYVCGYAVAAFSLLQDRRESTDYVRE